MSSNKLQQILNDPNTDELTLVWLFRISHSVCTAAEEGNLRKIKELLNMQQEDRDLVLGQVSDKNEAGPTPLVLSCRYGQKEVVEYLVDNCCASVGQPGSASITVYSESVVEAQPLWFAAAAGHLDIVKFLLNSGATNKVSAFEMTPLLVASLLGHQHIVEHMISNRDLVGKQERIDALELLGASFVDQKQDLQEALKLWKRAMEQRYKDGVLVIPKALDNTLISAYDNMEEVETMMELEQMIPEPNMMQLQALLVRERILGPVYILSRGFRYAHAPMGNFKRCVSLWIYAIDMVQKFRKPLSGLCWESFCDIIDFFFDSKISADGGLPSENFNTIMMVFRRAVREAQAGQVALEAGELQDKDSVIIHDVIVNVLYLVSLLTKLLPNLEREEEVFKVKQAVHEFLMIGSKGYGGATPLHLACSQYTDNEYTNVHFSPHIPTINLLLECGAHLDARDDEGNTALHRAACNKPTDNGVIQSLLKNGAHFDSGNKDKKTFSDLLKDMRYEIVHPAVPLSLVCLAAKVVRKHDMELDSLPVCLQAFVLNH